MRCYTEDAPHGGALLASAGGNKKKKHGKKGHRGAGGGFDGDGIAGGSDGGDVAAAVRAAALPAHVLERTLIPPAWLEAAETAAELAAAHLVVATAGGEDGGKSHHARTSGRQTHDHLSPC